MKKLFMATLFLSSLAFAKPLTGEVNVSVKGMVCAFCAQGLTKAFKKLPEVQDVKVSLEEKSVHLVIKKDSTLEDAKIIETIKDAGYEGTIK